MRMRLVCAAVLALSVLLLRPARADDHCYLFRNAASGVTTLAFAYSPAVGGVVTGAAIEPGGTYPFDGKPWCWKLPAGTTATVRVTGAGSPGWTGTLVLGNGAPAAASGTYVLGGGDAAKAAQNCLPNSYPNNKVFCLTAVQTGVHVRCGTGHTGISGTMVVDHLSLTCPDGRKWELICANALGGRQVCNLNERQMCDSENQWSAADHCTHPGRP
jgi:hypothetical protein